MTTREKILQATLNNQPAASALPDISVFKGEDKDLVQKYMTVFKTIGGNCFLVDDVAGIQSLITQNYDATRRIVTTVAELSDKFELISNEADPHSYENIEVAIIKAHFSVAENGAVWLTEEVMGQRIIPYICQHLAVIVQADTIVPTLHEAYEKIGAGEYGFGAFIGGPSKTADIEQALVLGAHGPLTMTVFIMK
ncbi:MAG: LUD domain-containing protein [Bacteroidetes bacterium]|nr:LUD domain-containing protein [Bacteroidota bacterium]